MTPVQMPFEELILSGNLPSPAGVGMRILQLTRTEDFSAEELASVREWLAGKAISIYGGSFEVQNNIISKNILGLPETTQKG